MQAMLRWLDPILNPEACLPPARQPAMAEAGTDAVLKRLDLLLRQKVNFALGGDRRSRLKGHGLDFSGLREYTPGDDIRKMDWSVFARTLSPYIREYQEEKQLTLWLAVDFTPSMQFGRTQTKAQQAVEIAGLMSLLAQKANHQLGALLILGADCRVIAPKAGPAQTRHIMQAMLEALDGSPPSLSSNVNNGTTLPADPLALACRKLGHVMQKQHTVLFLSDFMAQAPDWEIPLGELSRHAQLLCLMLSDPVEQHLPAELGLLTLQDPETGEIAQIDTDDAGLLTEYSQAISAQQASRLNTLRRMGVAALALTETEPTQALLNLLTRTRSC